MKNPIPRRWRYEWMTHKKVCDLLVDKDDRLKTVGQALKDEKQATAELQRMNFREVGYRNQAELERDSHRKELDGLAIELDNANREVRALRKQYATRDEFDHVFSEAERAQHLAVEEGGSFRFRTKPSSMSVYQQQAEAREAS